MLVAVALIATIWRRPALAIVGGVLDGCDHPNVGTFVVPDGVDRDGDGLPDEDLNGDGLPDIPDVAGNCILIHPRVCLTVGHNTEGILNQIARGWYSLDGIKVSFSPDGQDPDSWLDISAVITHPDYDPIWNTGYGATPLADIGVLILKDPVAGITPATLAPAGYLDSLKRTGVLRTGNPSRTAPFTVVGYGIYGDAPVFPEAYLPFDGQRRSAQSRYRSLLDHWLFLDQNAAHGNGGTANLDSGGPTFWVDPYTGQEVLVALTSRGDAVAVATGIAYRTDTAEALDFIDAVIDAVEAGEL